MPSIVMIGLLELGREKPSCEPMAQLIHDIWPRSDRLAEIEAEPALAPVVAPTKDA